MSRGLLQQFPNRLGELARLWRNALDQRLKPMGLSHARGITLLLLSQQGGMSQSALAERVTVRGSTLARQLDLLEADGLIERRELADDRRVKTVYLTPRAEPLVIEIEEAAHELRREFLDGVTEAELRTCLSVFERVKRRLVDREAGAEPRRVAI